MKVDPSGHMGFLAEAGIGTIANFVITGLISLLYGQSWEQFGKEFAYGEVAVVALAGLSAVFKYIRLLNKPTSPKGGGIILQEEDQTAMYYSENIKDFAQQKKGTCAVQAFAESLEDSKFGFEPEVKETFKTNLYDYAFETKSSDVSGISMNSDREMTDKFIKDFFPKSKNIPISKFKANEVERYLIAMDTDKGGHTFYLFNKEGKWYETSWYSSGKESINYEYREHNINLWSAEFKFKGLENRYLRGNEMKYLRIFNLQR
jgi:hypothetical protein